MAGAMKQTTALVCMHVRGCCIAPPIHRQNRDRMSEAATRVSWRGPGQWQNMFPPHDPHGRCLGRRLVAIVREAGVPQSQGLLVGGRVEPVSAMQDRLRNECVEEHRHRRSLVDGVPLGLAHPLEAVLVRLGREQPPVPLGQVFLNLGSQGPPGLLEGQRQLKHGHRPEGRPGQEPLPPRRVALLLRPLVVLPIGFELGQRRWSLHRVQEVHRPDKARGAMVGTTTEGWWRKPVSSMLGATHKALSMPALGTRALGNSLESASAQQRTDTLTSSESESKMRAQGHRICVAAATGATHNTHWADI